jgi:hypothetical protein
MQMVHGYTALREIVFRWVVVYHEFCHFVVSVFLFLSIEGISIRRGRGYVRVKYSGSGYHEKVKLFFAGIAPSLVSVGVLLFLFIKGLYFVFPIVLPFFLLASALSQSDLLVVLESFPYGLVYVFLLGFGGFLFFNLFMYFFSY